MALFLLIDPFFTFIYSYTISIYFQCHLNCQGSSVTVCPHFKNLHTMFMAKCVSGVLQNFHSEHFSQPAIHSCSRSTFLFQIYIHVPGLHSCSMSTFVFQVYIHVPGLHSCSRPTFVFQVYIHVPCLHSCSRPTFMFQVYIRVPGLHSCSRSTFMFQVYIHVPGLHSCSRSTFMFQVYIHVPGLHSCSRSTFMFQVYTHVPGLHSCSRSVESRTTDTLETLLTYRRQGLRQRFKRICISKYQDNVCEKWFNKHPSISKYSTNTKFKTKINTKTRYEERFKHIWISKHQDKRVTIFFSTPVYQNTVLTQCLRQSLGPRQEMRKRFNNICISKYQNNVCEKDLKHPCISKY